MCICMYLYTHEVGIYLYEHGNGTGWRRPIGRLKLRVSFRKRATNYRALLQKITYEDKASYESSPPCITRYNAVCSSREALLYEHLCFARVHMYIGEADTMHTCIYTYICIYIYIYIRVCACKNIYVLRV